MKYLIRYCYLIATALILSLSCQAREASEVWNLDEFKQTPEAQWIPLVEREDIVVQKVWYKSEPFHGKPTKTFAYIARPKGDGPFPGVVLVHGGGGSAFREWAELWAKRGYAAIAMDLAGCEKLDNGKNVRMADGGPGQGDEEKFRPFTPSDYKDMWTYHAIANVVRAHSLLLSQPYVDKDKTAATGISWGGYLTSMVSGVDDRFKAIVPVYGCGGLPPNSVWTQRINALPDHGKLWFEYFDPIQYCGNAKCRVCFMAGTDDFAYPLDIHYNTYSKVQNADVRLEVHMRHSHPDGWAPKEIGAYIDSVLLGKPSLPFLEDMTVAKNCDGSIRVFAKIKVNAESAVSAKLHYSTDKGGYVGNKWTVRNWSSIPATIDKKAGTVEALIPADLAQNKELRAFMEVTNSDGLTASSHYTKFEN